MSNLESLIVDFHAIDAIKIGKFVLKSGSVSPVYFDLRTVISHPKTLVKLCNILWEKIKDLKFDCICGVPYAALPIASGISLLHGVPMVIRRKEAKGYGTNNLIEGSFKNNQTCLIIEDIITSGGSIYDTVQVLQSVGLKVNDAVIILDREQGGPENLLAKGINCINVCTSSHALSVLHKCQLIDDNILAEFKKYQSENQVLIKSSSLLRLPFSQRAQMSSHPLTKHLFEIMESKQTNLCLSADVTSTEELLELAEKVGPHICILKTHIDIIRNFNYTCVEDLKKIAAKHKFLIFEDRKYADIGSTVLEQYTGGIFKTSEWADLINAHVLPGPGLISGLKKEAINLNRGCILIAEMSSAGNLITKSYTEAALKMGEENADFVIGYICQSRLSKDPKFIHFMPGVKFGGGGDDLGQQFTTPEEAILKKEVDVIIVGRGITKSEDPAATAKEYQAAAYKAYISACKT